MLANFYKKVVVFFTVVRPYSVFAQGNMSLSCPDAVSIIISNYPLPTALKRLSLYTGVAENRTASVYLTITYELEPMVNNLLLVSGNKIGKYSVAYVTVPSIDVGKSIAQGLVRNKLAACVNIIPQVISIYEWKNEINEDQESLLMIKTRTSQVDRLTDYVRSNHPYEVCEVISLPIKNGNPPYLRWIGDNVPENTDVKC